jgi:DTW domain-containing protein YfiP
MMSLIAVDVLPAQIQEGCWKVVESFAASFVSATFVQSSATWSSNRKLFHRQPSTTFSPTIEIR